MTLKMRIFSGVFLIAIMYLTYIYKFSKISWNTNTYESDALEPRKAPLTRNGNTKSNESLYDPSCNRI